MHSLLIILCMNGNLSFIKNVLLLKLITDFHLTNYIIKADDIKLNTEQHHFKGDTVQDVVLLQNSKFSLTRSNFNSTCSPRPN